MVDVAWELRETGPPEAECTVLLLPGGLCNAGSYAEVMAEPALSGTRLVAATLPGNAGAPPLNDYSMENYALVTTELARQVSADVVVGYSIGGSVAFEMVVSGGFTGPVVLLGHQPVLQRRIREKGDGGLTDDERGTLESCQHAQVVTIPGNVFFLPIEASPRVADVIVEAVGQTSSVG